MSRLKLQLPDPPTCIPTSWMQESENLKAVSCHLPSGSIHLQNTLKSSMYLTYLKNKIALKKAINSY